MTAFNLDNLNLMQIFSSMGNKQTGVGTLRDKSQSVELNIQDIKLSEQELESQYRRSGLLRKIVSAYPAAARESWCRLQFPTDSDFEGVFNDKGIADLFYIASHQANLYGNFYLLIGVADGRKTSEPIRWEGINSLVGFSKRRNLKKEDGYYIENIAGNEKSWHPDRILEFTGVPLYDEFGELTKGDSIYYSILEAYIQWVSALKSSSAMIADYNFLKVGIKGLGQILKTKDGIPPREGQAAILSRLLSLDMNRSVSKSVAYDLENELLSGETRSYSGADKIMDNLKDFLSVNVDIPRWKLFNEQQSSGLSTSTTASHIQKVGWASLVQEWKSVNWKPHLQHLIKIYLHAKDSPIVGNEIPEIIFPLGLTVSELEQAQLELVCATKLEKLIKSGIITTEEARLCYKGGLFTQNVTLIG